MLTDADAAALSDLLCPWNPERWPADRFYDAGGPPVTDPATDRRCRAALDELNRVRGVRSAGRRG